MEDMKKSHNSICPSEEFVNNLLKRCARELGVEYEPDEDIQEQKETIE